MLFFLPSWMCIKPGLCIRVSSYQKKDYVFSLTDMGIFIRVLCFCLASGLLFATLGTGERLWSTQIRWSFASWNCLFIWFVYQLELVYQWVDVVVRDSSILEHIYFCEASIVLHNLWLYCRVIFFLFLCFVTSKRIHNMLLHNIQYSPPKVQSHRLP